MSRPDGGRGRLFRRAAFCHNQPQAYLTRLAGGSPVRDKGENVKSYRLVVTFCLVLGFFAVAGLADQLVIVASTVEELPRGTMVDGSAELTLAAGSSLTLVSKSGELMKLEGPFQGIPSSGDPGEGDAGLLFALEQLLENRKAEETPGVFRAAPGGDQPAGPWWIDTSRSGHYCVHPAHPPVLWRPRPAAAEGVEIRQLRGGGAGEAQWAAGEATAPWPEKLKLDDGGAYVVHAWNGLPFKCRLSSGQSVL